MVDRLREARREESGFSLVELLIVIVVLGILAGIVVFGVGTFRSDAAKTACTSEAKTVKVAATAYLARNGGTIAGKNSAARVDTLVTAAYLEATPTYVTNISLTNAGAVTDTCSKLK